MADDEEALVLDEEEDSIIILLGDASSMRNIIAGPHDWETDEPDDVNLELVDSLIIAPHADDAAIDAEDDSSAMSDSWQAMGIGDVLLRRFLPSVMIVMALSTSPGVEHR